LRQDAPEIEAASVGGLFQLKNMSRVPSRESVTNDNRDPANKGPRLCKSRPVNENA
jgi:hypothetical protein